MALNYIGLFLETTVHSIVLLVISGRDGRDGRPGPPGPVGQPGLPGKFIVLGRAISSRAISSIKCVHGGHVGGAKCFTSRITKD